MEVTDIDLVKGSISGSQQAFEKLVARYKKLIFSVIYNMINNREEACDISQEVFLRIYKSLDKYNPEYKFSTWAVKIATNLCLDALRRKKIDTMPIDDVIGIFSDKETPEESYIKRERGGRIRKAVAELPDKYRIPIVLFHQNGLSYEEIMNIINEPMSIVKNRIYRARLILRDKLSPDRKEEAL